MIMTADRWQDPCARCGRPRGKHAIIGEPNCPRRWGRGFRKSVFVEPGE